MTELLLLEVPETVVADTATLAYCAGIIDADGCIRVKRSTYAMRVTRDSGQASYSESVQVCQVEPAAVEVLRRVFGGTLYLKKPASVKARPLYAWSVTDKKAATCLRAVLPYLRIKREQAENCLRLRELKTISAVAKVRYGRSHAGAAPRSLVLTQQMDALYQRSRELNSVGTGGDVK